MDEGEAHSYAEGGSLDIVVLLGGEEGLDERGSGFGTRSTIVSARADRSS